MQGITPISSKPTKAIESKIICNIPLKTPEHIEQTVATLTATIQEAARTTTTPEKKSERKMAKNVELEKAKDT